MVTWLPFQSFIVVGHGHQWSSGWCGENAWVQRVRLERDIYFLHMSTSCIKISCMRCLHATCHIVVQWHDHIMIYYRQVVDKLMSQSVKMVDCWCQHVVCWMMWEWRGRSFHMLRGAMDRHDTNPTLKMWHPLFLAFILRGLTWWHACHVYIPCCEMLVHKDLY